MFVHIDNYIVRGGKMGASVVVLVGYTNVGKSTLLNRLSHFKSVSDR